MYRIELGYPAPELEEDLDIDPSIIEAAFCRGIRGGAPYVEKLLSKAMSDYELHSEKNMNQCLLKLRDFVSIDKDNCHALLLEDLVEEFGLPKDLLPRLSQLILQIDNTSPTASSRLQDSKSTPNTIRSEDCEEIDEDDYGYDNDFEDTEGEDSKSSSAFFLAEMRVVANYKGRGKFYPGIIKRDRGGGTFDILYEDGDNEEYVPEDRIRPQSEGKKSSHKLREVDDQRVPKIQPAIDPVAFIRQRVSGNANRPHTTPERETTANSTSMAVNDSQDLRGSALRSSSAGAAKRRGKPVSWILEKKWILGEKIGEGSFGLVFQCMNDKGKLYAAKRLDVNGKKDEVDNLVQEIQLMRGLSHHNIVEYVGSSVDEKLGQVYIFQEWMPGGSVAHLLKRFGAFSEGIVRNYTRQIMAGLCYLHKNGIIHRDIKGGNLLVDEAGTVKLADFGASTVTQFDQTQQTTTIKGTPYFMAPEVLAQSRYGRKGDVWAVGCTIIQMLTGEPPWKDHNLAGLVQLHMLLTSWTEGPPRYSCEVSSDLRECLELCFAKDEQQRPSAESLSECAFLQNGLDESGDIDGDGRDDFQVLTTDEEAAALEDSGVLSGLKQQMFRAVNNRGSFEDDSISANIEMRLRQNEAHKVGPGQGRCPAPGRGHGRGGSASDSPQPTPLINPANPFGRQAQHSPGNATSAAHSNEADAPKVISPNPNNPFGRQSASAATAAGRGIQRHDGRSQSHHSSSTSPSAVATRAAGAVGGAASRLPPAKTSSGSSSSGRRIVDGAAVEANYHGRGNWYPGVITRDNGNGTFDIIYDDEDAEENVPETLIRLLDAKLLGPSARQPPSPDRETSEVEEGSGVRGRGNYIGSGPSANKSQLDLLKNGPSVRGAVRTSIGGAAGLGTGRGERVGSDGRDRLPVVPSANSTPRRDYDSKPGGETEDECAERDGAGPADAHFTHQQNRSSFSRRPSGSASTPALHSPAVIPSAETSRKHFDSDQYDTQRGAFDDDDTVVVTSAVAASTHRGNPTGHSSLSAPRVSSSGPVSTGAIRTSSTHAVVPTVRSSTSRQHSSLMPMHQHQRRASATSTAYGAETGAAVGIDIHDSDSLLWKCSHCEYKNDDPTYQKFCYQCAKPRGKWKALER